jgi:hypothetical protein
MAAPDCERLNHIYGYEQQVLYSSLISMLNACLFNSTLYCCFKYVDVYLC